MNPNHGLGSGAALHPIVFSKAAYGTTWVERVSANWYRVATMSPGGTHGDLVGYTNDLEDAKRMATRGRPLKKRGAK